MDVPTNSTNVCQEPNVTSQEIQRDFNGLCYVHQTYSCMNCTFNQWYGSSTPQEHYDFTSLSEQPFYEEQEAQGTFIDPSTEASSSTVQSTPFMHPFKYTPINNRFGTTVKDKDSIQTVADNYKHAAETAVSNLTWNGQLPEKEHDRPFYSCKVFLGGVPRTINEPSIHRAFRPFGSVKVHWPRTVGLNHCHQYYKTGHVYVIFQSQKMVKRMLESCRYDLTERKYYYRIYNRQGYEKQVEVIPWIITDNDFMKQPFTDPSKTVFVGGLHGTITAKGLAMVMNDLFGPVMSVSLDTDQYRYPLGSGHVIFCSSESYFKALNTQFLEINTSSFNKRVQIDPFLQDSLCCYCSTQPGIYFCRDFTCFSYYCASCWQWFHNLDATVHHQPLIRKCSTWQHRNVLK